VPQPDDAVPADVNSNVTDIQLLDLFNVLFLTSDQSIQLLEMMKSAKNDYDALELRCISNAKKSIPILEKMAKEPDIIMKDAAFTIQYDEMKNEEKKIDADYTATDKKYLQMLKEMLSDNQVHIIGKFVPIIDSPESEKSMPLSPIAATTDIDDTDKRLVSYLTSSNMIPLLQARLNGDFLPPAPMK
jgi:hypothetical protein